MTDLLKHIWLVWGQMAPFLLFGFVVAGILYVFIKPSFVRKHLGKNRISSIVKTTFLGVPLPLCSCGVIPVAASLRLRGAGKGATTAFLLATPQTGVDSIAVTYSLMGGFFALFRPIAAMITGIAGGIIVSIFDRDKSESSETDSSGTIQNPDMSDDACIDKTDASATLVDSDQNTVEKPFSKIMTYSFYSLPRDIGRALTIGVILAGLIGAYVPPELLQKIPGGVLMQMLFMMIIGIPIYVCATSSIPVAAALIMKGISPGAALVFLITGPATNAATISTIWKVMGRRTAIIYLIVVAVFALLSGLAADYLISTQFEYVHQICADDQLALWETVAGILLILILVNAARPSAAGLLRSR